MAGTRIAVSNSTKRLLGSLRARGESYDDVVRRLLTAPPAVLTDAAIAARVRNEEPEGAIEELIAASKRQKF